MTNIKNIIKLADMQIATPKVINDIYKFMRYKAMYWEIRYSHCTKFSSQDYLLLKAEECSFIENIPGNHDLEEVIKLSCMNSGKI